MPGAEHTRRWPGLLAWSLLLLATPARAEKLTLDLAQTPFTVSRAAEKFTAKSAREGTVEVRLVGGLEDRPRKCGEVLFKLPAAWASRPWGNRATVRAQVRVGPVFQG